MSPESTQPPVSRQGQRCITTEKQHESARTNGRKSRGPINVEGKLRNRLNGFKHGAYSESSLILPEDQNRFNAIFEDYIENYKPTTELELELIEQNGLLLLAPSPSCRHAPSLLEPGHHRHRYPPW